jgi:3',5'-cyclic AMP phosphodiesterase CpdA
MKPFATFLHLSDTHLGERFDDAGGPSREAVQTLADGGRLVMQAHDTQILLMLPMELQRRFDAVRERDRTLWGAEYEDTDFFDRVLFTGDVSTDATSEKRFAFAFDYVTGQVQADTTGPYADQSRIGLRIPPGRLLCVPGNHDKLREKSLQRFHSAFAKVPAPANYVTFVRRYGRAVVFFGLDSNEYTEGTIGRGQVDAARLAWLSNTLTTIERDGLTVEGDRLTPEEFKTAVRCLLLHHHVTALSFRRKFTFTNPLRRMTILLGADKLLDLIAGRIDVVFHGHEHYPVTFVHEESGALVVSAGSTSQWYDDGYNNSFYVVTFFTDHTIEINEFVWTGNGFSGRDKRDRVLTRRYDLPRLQRLGSGRRSA